MRKGFSLFEMLLALSLMALLGSFVIPNLQKIQQKSNRLAAEINTKTFQAALENHYLDTDAYPIADYTAAELYTDLNTGGFLKSSPINPYTKKAYAGTDTKGKIAYQSTTGETYQLTLYEADGATVQMTLTNM